MLLSQKCQYALRAVFELTRRVGQGPVKIGDIADAQAIPVRFLEVILSQLKQGGFVESRRGNEGGYFLIRSPEGLTVGEIIRFVEGPIGPVGCLADKTTDRESCPLRGDCVFLDMWDQVRQAVEGVYDSTSLQDLVNRDRSRREDYIASYCI